MTDKMDQKFLLKVIDKMDGDSIMEVLILCIL